MVVKLKFLILGFIVGAIVAFPLGINFGRDEPLLSNPFEKRAVKEQVREVVTETGKEIVEEAREKLHEATEPVKKKLEK